MGVKDVLLAAEIRSCRHCELTVLTTWDHAFFFVMFLKSVSLTTQAFNDMQHGIYFITH